MNFINGNQDRKKLIDNMEGRDYFNDLKEFLFNRFFSYLEEVDSEISVKASSKGFHVYTETFENRPYKSTFITVNFLKGRQKFFFFDEFLHNPKLDRLNDKFGFMTLKDNYELDEKWKKITVNSYKQRKISKLKGLKKSEEATKIIKDHINKVGKQTEEEKTIVDFESAIKFGIENGYVQMEDLVDLDYAGEDVVDHFEAIQILADKNIEIIYD